MANPLQLLKDGIDRVAGKKKAELPKENPQKAADKIGGYTKKLGIDEIRKNKSQKDKIMAELD